MALALLPPYLALLPPYLAQGATPPTLLTTATHHGYSPLLLTTAAHHCYSPLLRRQVACAVIEEALQHGLATKISRKEVRCRYSHRCAAYLAPRTPHHGLSLQSPMATDPAPLLTLAPLQVPTALLTLAPTTGAHRLTNPSPHYRCPPPY